MINGVTASYKINAPVSLQSGYTFSTQLGSGGSLDDYMVITSLGSQDDWKYTSTVMNSLQAMARKNNLNTYYALGADIDANSTAVWNSGNGFTPIGGPSKSFSGRLEGLGHQINGLNINRSSTSNMGLFGKTSAALISNFRMNNLNVTGDGNTGGLIGNAVAETRVFNVSLAGQVTGSYDVGGIIGQFGSGSISESSFKGQVIGNMTEQLSFTMVGGLVGTMSGNTSIDKSFFDGQLMGLYIIGGLAGYVDYGAVITNSYANVKVVGSLENVGGLVGSSSGVAISNSYATGSISANQYVGGLIGSDSYGDVQNSFSTVVVSGLTNTGALIGIDYTPLFSNYSNNYYYASNSHGDSVGAGIGLTSAQMLQASNFTGFDFTNTWFSYEGKTTPLLRSFLTPLNVTVDVSGSKNYDGTTACGSIACGYNIDNSSLISGKQLLGTGVVSLSGKNADSVTGSLSGLYSDQQGYLINTIYTGMANIDKADLTVTATQTTKTYDGTTNAPGTGIVGDIAGAGAGESVKTAGSQAYLDKNAGNNKTVRASGVTIQDNDKVDVSANYNINYIDNTSSSIESILVGNQVPQPSLLVAQPLNTAFDTKSIFYVEPTSNASAINPSLVVPAALQKSIILKKKVVTECIQTGTAQDAEPNSLVKTCSE